MNEMSLSALYRRLTSSGSVPAVASEEIVAAVDGTLDDARREDVAEGLSASAPHAALAHVLRDIRAGSEQLAIDVGRARRDTAHRRHAREGRRIGSGRRFGGVARWTAAAAACLVAVLGVWTQHREASPNAVAPVAQSVIRARDEIFSTRDKIFADTLEANVAKPNRGDELFRGTFSG